MSATNISIIRHYELTMIKISELAIIKIGHIIINIHELTIKKYITLYKSIHCFIRYSPLALPLTSFNSMVLN